LNPGSSIASLKASCYVAPCANFFINGPA
jgi:hypothetical protein